VGAHGSTLRAHGLRLGLAVYIGMLLRRDGAQTVRLWQLGIEVRASEYQFRASHITAISGPTVTR